VCWNISFAACNQNIPIPTQQKWVKRWIISYMENHPMTPLAVTLEVIG
jgi:hypothetical protein